MCCVSSRCGQKLAESGMPLRSIVLIICGPGSEPGSVQVKQVLAILVQFVYVKLRKKLDRRGHIKLPDCVNQFWLAHRGLLFCWVNILLGFCVAEVANRKVGQTISTGDFIDSNLRNSLAVLIATWQTNRDIHDGFALSDCWTNSCEFVKTFGPFYYLSGVIS